MTIGHEDILTPVLASAAFRCRGCGTEVEGRLLPPYGYAGAWPRLREPFCDGCVAEPPEVRHLAARVRFWLIDREGAWARADPKGMKIIRSVVKAWAADLGVTADPHLHDSALALNARLDD